MKKLTYQSMNKAGSRDVGERSARISRLEGMEGHARSADVRLVRRGCGCLCVCVTVAHCLCYHADDALCGPGLLAGEILS